MGTQVFIEALDLSEAQIDSETKTVRQVLIRAGTSKNRRHYSAKVLQEAAQLFDGVKTYANHPSRAEQRERPERSVRDVTGWITGVKFEEGALVGVRHFANTTAGQDTWALVEQIVKGDAPPSLIGGSINAVGTGKDGQIDGEDVVVVESIRAVQSVDDVTTPAAGGAFQRLMASAGGDITAALLQEISYEEWFECRPDFTERFQNEHRKARWSAATREAKEQAAQYRAQFEEAQGETRRLTEERDQLAAERDQLQRTVRVVEVLTRVTLPASWKESLREQLMKTDEDEWSAIIDGEIRKAKRANATPRVEVTGAGLRVNENLVSTPESASPVPLPGENAEQWMERTKRAQQTMR